MNNIQVKPSRILFLDLTKFFAIFCVILGHVIQQTFPGDPYHDSLIFQFIYSFHMPLFMMVSGYFIGKTFTMSPLSFLKKRSIQLLLPVLTFSVLFVIFHNTIYTQLTGKEAINFFGYLTGGWMWFLKYLFICSVVVYVSKKIFRNDAWAAILPTLLLISLTRATIFRLLPFLWAGYFLNKYKDKIFKHQQIILWGSFFLFLFFLYFWKGDYDASYRFIYLKDPIRIDIQNFLITIIRLGVGFSGSIFFITLFKYFTENIRPGKLLSTCCETGRNTLGIYCLQIYILEFGLDHLPIKLSFPGAIILQLIAALIILIICDCLVRIIKKNKWTALFLLGMQKGPKA